MTNKLKQDDPAAAARDATMALAAERTLNTYLDRIIAKEKVRSEASADIAAIWSEVRKAGIDIADARKALVWRSCAVA